jgi:hypothetical protein
VDLTVITDLFLKFLQITHKAAKVWLLLLIAASFDVCGVVFSGLFSVAILVRTAAFEQNRRVTYVELGSVNFNLGQIE